MKKSLPSFPMCVSFVLLAALFGLFAPLVQAQLDKIENKLPKIVPLEVGFKNYDKENWWHDLEIKVTNTGKRPIYYLDLTLWLDATYVGSNAAGKQMAIKFRFGDIRRYSHGGEELANPDDPAILPGESYTFKVDEGTVKGFDLLKNAGSFVEPRSGELIHQSTNFGDGTGFLPGGTPFRQKKNAIRASF